MAIVVLAPKVVAVPVSDVVAGVAHLQHVSGIDVLDWDTSVSSFILDTALQSIERPCVESSVHPLSVVHDSRM